MNVMILSQSLTVSECLKNGIEFLASSGVPEAQVSAEALLSYVLNRPRFSLYLETDRAVEETERLQFEALLTKRASRYPLQYLVKQVPFRNVTLEIGEGCLIPRPETEILVEAVLKRLHVYGAVVEVLDVGTGSGNIAISLAKEEPSWYVTGTDVSSQALRYAKKNAELNSVEDRVRLVQTDLWHDIKKEKFDIIVSNPPYLTSDELEMHIFGEEHQVLPEHFRRRTSSSPRRVLAQRRAAKYSRKKRAVLQPEVAFEPRSSLDGGRDGLAFFRRIIQNAHAILKPKGFIFFEVGLGQAESVCEFLKTNGFQNIQCSKDDSNIDRVISAQFSPQSAASPSQWRALWTSPPRHLAES